MGIPSFNVVSRTSIIKHAKKRNMSETTMATVKLCICWKPCASPKTFRAERFPKLLMYLKLCFCGLKEFHCWLCNYEKTFCYVFDVSDVPAEKEEKNPACMILFSPIAIECRTGVAAFYSGWSPRSMLRNIWAFMRSSSEIDKLV